MNINNNQITDEDLILQFQNGDEIAFNAICERYRDKLINFIFRFIYDVSEAEDLAQDTLLKVYQNKHSYKSIAKFSTWIYTIAGNLAKTRLRQKKTRKTTPMSHIGKDDFDIIQTISGNIEEGTKVDEEFENALENALDKLSLDFRLVIILRQVQGLPYEDISKIISMPIGTVKSRINRARKKLKELLYD